MKLERLEEFHAIIDELRDQRQAYILENQRTEKHQGTGVVRRQPGQVDVREFRVEERDGGDTNVHKTRITGTDEDHVFWQLNSQTTELAESFVARNKWMCTIGTSKLLQCQWVVGKQEPDQCVSVFGNLEVEIVSHIDCSVSWFIGRREWFQSVP